MKDIFKSPRHQAHYNEYGYVLMDTHLEAEIAEMDGFINSVLNHSSPDFYYSLIVNDLETNKRIREKIRCGLQSFYDAVLTDYKSVNESFLMKPAHTKDELLLHQDWCYTHEDKFHSLTLWMPLCDVDENNGALFFVPGSHKWFNNLRSCSFPTARILSKDMPAGKVQKVSMRKGQVLLFHPAVFHGSFANNSDQDRKVVTSVILPQSADYVYFQAVKDEPNNNVKTFKLDDDSFLRELRTIAVGANPSTEVVDQFHYEHRVISAEDLFTRAQQA